MRRLSYYSNFGFLALVLALTGCSAAYYRKSADKAAYAAIQQKTPLVKDMDPNFTIEQTNAFHLDGLPVVTNVADYLGENGKSEKGAYKVSLKDALRIAVHQSRSYQSHKEDLYLSALSLTLARHEWTPIYSLSGNAKYSPISATIGTALRPTSLM